MSGLVSAADNPKFENRLDPDQTRQNVGPDLNPNCLVPSKLILKRKFQNKQILKNVALNYPAYKELHVLHVNAYLKQIYAY